MCAFSVFKIDEKNVPLSVNGMFSSQFPPNGVAVR